MNRHEPLSDPLLATIRALLLSAGLSYWLPVLEEWLARYAGLDKWLSNPADGPMVSVLKLLQSYAESKSPVADADFAADLARLPFLYWHARWPAWQGGVSSWDAMVEPLSQFERRRGADHWPALWESDHPMLDPGLVRNYLLEQLRTYRDAVSRGVLG